MDMNTIYSQLPETDKEKKMEQDFSELVKDKLEKLREQAKIQLGEALDELLSLEKQTRQGGDEPSTTKVVRCLVEVCLEARDWARLKDLLVVISKRRQQFRNTIQTSVQTTMEAFPSLPDKATKLDLIDTLRTITEGKIFVEVERARLTRMLAQMKEAEGNVNEAAELLQEVQVESFGTMEALEKLDFILEQIRLCLANSDFVRAQIISRKVTNKALSKPEFQEMKVSYHKLMIKFYTHQKEYLNIARSYWAIYDTPVVLADATRWQPALTLAAVSVALAPYDNEQFDLLNRIYSEKRLNELPQYKKLLKYCITEDLIHWSVLLAEYKGELLQLPSFAENAEALLKDLRARVMEHNIRVVAQYYERINTPHFAQLLGLDEAELERFISDMVSNGVVYAKIDRPRSVVSFVKRKAPGEVLNEYSHNISDLLNLLEKTCHLIHRENMVHGL
jgi:26S proteasome regulatory subunit N5